jgi:uncharacterized membrane protein
MSRPSPRSYPPSVALAAGGVFLLCFALVHTWFWLHEPIVDWPTYRLYGEAIRHGHVPYRAFAVEYPPLALPVFLVPVVAGDYAAAFAWLMAACGLATCAVVAAVRPPAAFFVAVSPVLAGSLYLSRFDQWPALLTVSALALLLAERDAWGWGFLGAAVAAKLWPAVIVPLALVWTVRRGRTNAVWAGVAVVAVSFLPFALLAPHGLWHSVAGQGSRPLQIESLGAALLTTFAHPLVITTHGSQNIAAHHTLSAIFGVVQLVALAVVWFAFARGPASSERLVRYSAAAVCAFVAFGKVLSPQFLLWLVPLVPLVRGRRGVLAAALLAAAMLVTQIWFPSRYFRYVEQFHLAGVVLVRDLLLVALLGVLLWPLRAESNPV